jgi:hypothetical protein
MVRLCALALLLGAVVHAQPFASSLLDTAFTIGPDQYGTEANTASAIGDSSGLVVWNSDGHVKGCLTTNGRTSSATACIDISGPNETFIATPLDVAKSPGGYLVVWRGDQGSTLRGAVVSLSGEVVMRETVANYSVGWPIANPAVAFDGANYLVAWDEYLSSTEHGWVLCMRVSPAGEVLDSPHKVCPAGGAQSNVSLRFGDSCFLAAYLYWVPGQAESGVWCSRILPNGVVLDSAGIPVRHWPGPGADNTQARVTVGFDGTDFVVGWTEYVLSPSEVRAARVTPSGVVLDPEGLEIGHDHEGTVSSACVRDTTLLVWTHVWNDTVTISGRRLSGAGQLLDTSDILITPPVCAHHSNCHPGVASVSRCGDGFLVTYSDYAPNSDDQHNTFDLLSRRVSARGQVLDTAGTLLSYAANYQTEADAASDGQAFLAVWTDLRAGSTGHDCAVYGARFSNEGSALDAASFRIGQWGSHTPSIAYGAGCYMATWLTDFGSDSSQVWAARVGRDGVPLDTNPIRLPGIVYDVFQGVPDIAFSDSLFLVAWHYGGFTGCACAARVRADGVLLDSVPILLETPYQPVNNTPRIAGDGHGFLVVWEDHITRHFYGLRVGSSGQVLDSTAIDFGRHGSQDYLPGVAYGAGVYLAVESMGFEWAWRVTPGGVVLDTIHWHPGLTCPQVTYDGANFFLVDGVGNRFRAVRISPQGEVIDSLRFNLIDLRPESTYLTDIGFGLTADLQGHVGMAFATYESNPYVAARMRASAFPVVVGAVNEQGVAFPNEARRARIISRATPLVISEPAALLDITGRKLRDLKPGKYDMRGYGTGVFLLRLKARATVMKFVVVE